MIAPGLPRERHSDAEGKSDAVALGDGNGDDESGIRVRTESGSNAVLNLS